MELNIHITEEEGRKLQVALNQFFAEEKEKMLEQKKNLLKHKYQRKNDPIDEMFRIK